MAPNAIFFVIQFNHYILLILNIVSVGWYYLDYVGKGKMDGTLSKNDRKLQESI